MGCALLSILQTLAAIVLLAVAIQNSLVPWYATGCLILSLAIQLLLNISG
jgi:hypothetical protein